MTTVRIGAAPLSVDDLLAVVDGARVVLERPARDRIAAARAVVDEALAAGSAVYGLTTRVGHLRDVRLTAEEVHREQEFLVRSHAGGLGPALPVPVVRAAMVVRLAGVARGGSGASPAVADTLAAMLDAGVHPVVPETGSVGAADVAQMAWIAQVAVGLGRAEYRGEVLPGGEALRRAGIPPLVLAGKDGLALVSATGVSVGQAALVVARAARAAEAADVAAALSMGRRGPTPRSCTRPWAARRASRGRWRRPTTSATCWPAVPCWGPAARCRCRTPCPSGSSRRCTGCCASTSLPRAPRCRPSWPRRRTTRWCRSRTGCCRATATSTRWCWPPTRCGSPSRTSGS